MVARYGGEEFVIVLPHTDQEGALQIAEQIRLSIKSLEFEHQTLQTKTSVTISMGIASMIPQKTQSSFYLLKHADKGLYQSKQEGRDHISIYDESKEG